MDDDDCADSGSCIKKYSPVAKHPFVIFTALLGLAYIYGGAQVNIHSGSFYQNSLANYAPPSVPVGCLAGWTDGSGPQQSAEYWLNQSVKLANAGAKLILWSELTLLTKDDEEEAAFLESAKNFSATHRVYLAAGYGTKSMPPEQNKLVLLSPEGKLLIDYNKAHPVPFVVRNSIYFLLFLTCV